MKFKIPLKIALTTFLSATALIGETSPSLYNLLNYGPEKFQRFKNYRFISKKFGSRIWSEKQIGNGDYLCFYKHYLKGYLFKNTPEVVEVFAKDKTKKIIIGPIAFLMDFYPNARFENTPGNPEVWCEPFKDPRTGKKRKSFGWISGEEYPCSERTRKIIINAYSQCK